MDAKIIQGLLDKFKQEFPKEFLESEESLKRFEPGEPLHHLKNTCIYNSLKSSYDNQIIKSCLLKQTKQGQLKQL